jgi:predicted MFS family arabinose efflux permease
MIAARFGKRLTLGGSILFFGVGILCCSFASCYWMLLPCLMIAGIGEGVCEGIATPFVQDLHPDAPERYVNISHAFWSVGIVGAVVVVSGLISLGVSWRPVLAAIGLLSMLMSLVLLWRENPDKKYPESTSEIKVYNLLEKSKKIFRRKHFYICCAAMFFGAGAEFGLTFWATSFIELTFKTSLFVAGLGTGTIAAGMIAGRTFFGYIAKPGNLLYILFATAASTVPVTALLALLKPGMIPDGLLFLILFCLLFAAGIGVSVLWPTTQVYGVNVLEDCDSTLLYIYYSTLGIPGCGVFSYLMGAVGDRFGLTGSILVVPVCLAVFCAIIYYEIRISAEKSATLKKS